MAEGKWEDCRDLYQYGERWQRSEPAEQNDNEEVSDNVPVVCSDSIKMLLRRHAPAAWDMEEPEKNREWGNLIHMAMSKISRADQVVPVLQELLVNGLISSAQQVDLSVLMAGILANPEMSVFFDPGYTVMNEPEILTPEGFLYRPDRVLIKQDHVIIIDFKTGKQRKEHYDQVLLYSRLLKEMNYRVDGVFLLYLDRQPEVLRVI